MENEPSPTEDLMREHGLLNRIMLIYENMLLDITNANFELLFSATKIIKDFIEDYHEPMEEKYIFAFLLERNIEVELINELTKQHQLSKYITNKIFKYIKLSEVNKNDANMLGLEKYIKLFLYMYRAHETREDTIIFNAFRKNASKELMNELTEIFERSENERFGENGYENILEKVIEMEKKLGIWDLNVYTPILKKIEI